MNKRQVLQEQKKDSPRRLRKVLVIPGVVLIVPIVLIIGIIASSWYVESHRPTVGDAMAVGRQYYQHIQKQDYTNAYHFLDKNATITVHSRPVVMNSVDTLATASQALDTQNGLIRSYPATGGDFEQGKDIVDLTMQITRSSHSYNVHLKLLLVSGTWKILSADGI